MASCGRENSRVSTGTLLIQTALCWEGKCEAQAFCAGLSACIGRCLRDADGSEGQPATTSLCKDRVGSAAGAAPVVSRMTLPAA